MNEDGDQYQEVLLRLEDETWKGQLCTLSDEDELRRRASVLAAPEVLDNIGGNLMEVLVFMLGGEQYAIEMDYIKEVVLLRQITPLPKTPDFLLGIINLRGDVLSIVDLRTFFGMQRKGLSDYNRVIVLKNDNMEFGMLADRVSGMKMINTEDIHPPPSTVGGIGADFLLGVLPGPLILINAKKVLTDPRMIVGSE